MHTPRSHSMQLHAVTNNSTNESWKSWYLPKTDSKTFIEQGCACDVTYACTNWYMNPWYTCIILAHTYIHPQQVCILFTHTYMKPRRACILLTHAYMRCCVLLTHTWIHNTRVFFSRTYTCIHNKCVFFSHIHTCKPLQACILLQHTYMQPHACMFLTLTNMHRQHCIPLTHTYMQLRRKHKSTTT
jgi:hypothetical protein